jgi:hypothetical protein
VHHSSTGSSPSVRPRRRRVRRRAGVLALLGTLCAAALLAIGTPAVSGGGELPAALDARTSAGVGPRVVMGVDGAPAPTPAVTSGVEGTVAPGTGSPVGTTSAPASPATGHVPGAAGSTSPTGATAGTATGTDPGTASTPAPDPTVPALSPSSAGTASPAGAGDPPAVVHLPTVADPSPLVAPSPSSVPAEPARDRSAAVVAALADARAAAGCDPLAADASLAGTAGDHDAAMAAAGSPGLAGLGGAPAVVSRGDAGAGAVVAGWLATGSGQAVLLDCTLSRLGAAELTGDDGPWWTAVLG